LNKNIEEPILNQGGSILNQEEWSPKFLLNQEEWSPKFFLNQEEWPKSLFRIPVSILNQGECSPKSLNKNIEKPIRNQGECVKSLILRK
jgi:hypothetical protein